MSLRIEFQSIRWMGGRCVLHQKSVCSFKKTPNMRAFVYAIANLPRLTQRLSRGYAGSSSAKHPEPHRGCGNSVPARESDLGHNAVGVVSIGEHAPKVGVARQPWAGGRNPFGIVHGSVLRLASESV